MQPLFSRGLPYRPEWVGVAKSSAMSQDAVVLKKGREWALLQRHHWIFSGAVESYPPDYLPGDLVRIQSHGGKVLGWGFFNPKLSLAGRVVSFGEEEVYSSLKKSLKKALELRQSLLNNPETTAYRLVNGEGDSLPSLIIDRYGPYLVIQTGSLGMRKLIPFWVEHLRELLPIAGIYDKSTAGSLREEGIEPQENVLWGEVPDFVDIKENGIRFTVSLKKGQKTGFFLDHREMRALVRGLSSGKRVLNAFCYTGGFTLAALKGGAEHVDSVDVSGSALELCSQNVLLNGFDASKNQCYAQDVFDFLAHNSCSYDLAILDPPAFAKKKKDISAASKGYKRIFEMAMRKMPSPSLLLLSSCSYYISEEHFEGIVKEAALEAKRPARIIGRHRLAFDHPINLFHGESSYLKSLLIEI